MEQKQKFFVGHGSGKSPAHKAKEDAKLQKKASTPQTESTWTYSSYDTLSGSNYTYYATGAWHSPKPVTDSGQKTMEQVMGHISEPTTVLEKAIKHAKHKVNYGFVGGVPIVAIGKLGGKIIGYDSKHKPIYASSSQGQKLIAQSKAAAEEKKQIKQILDWLAGLDITALPGKNGIRVSASSGKKLQEHFKIAPVNAGQGTFWTFNTTALANHVGKTLQFEGAQDLHMAAQAAAGELEEAHPDFPESLSSLVQTDKKFTGSHVGSWWKDSKTGRLYIFKAENPIIARAEEAASRLARLILGPGHVQSAKFVELNGESGVLIAAVEVDHAIGPEHKSKSPPLTNLKKYADDIAAQHVFDWLIANHDAHGDNFVITKKGDLVGIDKGQAWKWIGSDELSLEHVDHLDWNTNPSNTVYHFFWKQVQAGKITPPLKKIHETLTAIESLDNEHFLALVAPYVATQAGHTGQEASYLESKLLARKASMRSDFEKFVYKQVLKAPSVGKFHQPGAFKEPDAPPPPEPKPAPKQFSVAWPVTKGKVTVNAPGSNPEHGVLWPKGYPGPGYDATITYGPKATAKDYGLMFRVVDGKFLAELIHDNKQIGLFDSPSKAVNAIYLHHKGLDVNMSPAEMKEKKLGVNPKAVLKLKQFAPLFEQAKSTESTIASQSPDTIDPEHKTSEFSVYDQLAQSHVQPGELINDWALLPIEIQEHLKKHSGLKLDAYWKGKALPGGHAILRVKSTTGSNLVVYTSMGPDANGEPQYARWQISPQGTVTTGNHLQNELPKLVAYHIAAPATQIAVGGGFKTDKAPEVGPPPDLQTKPEKGAPAKPVTPGVTVTKKLKGIGPVKLIVNSDGTFTGKWTNKSGDPVTMSHSKMSKIGKVAWVQSKGFTSIPEYEKHTGKKVPGVGGKNWWGLETVEVPKPGTTPVDEPTDVEANKEKAVPEWQLIVPGLGDLDYLQKTFEKLPLDSKIEVVAQDKSVWSMRKTGPDEWTISIDDSPNPFIFTSIQVAALIGPPTSVVWSAKYVAGSTTPEMKATPSDPNWESFEVTEGSLGAATAELAKLPLGTRLKFTVDDGTKVTLTKKSIIDWLVEKQYTETSKDTYPLVQSSVATMLLHAKNDNTQVFKESTTSVDALAEQLTLAPPKPLPVQKKPPVKSKESDFVVDMIQKWLKIQTKDGQHTVADKPSGWPAWVPPPGVFVEGEYQGKKWYTVVVSGYGKSGKPGESVRFLIVDQNGKAFHGPKDVPAAQALSAFVSTFKQLFPNAPPPSANEVWPDLLAQDFPPGSNYETVASAVQKNSAALIEKMKEAMSLDEATKPVTATLPLPAAFPFLAEAKQYGDLLKLVPAGNGTHYVLKIGKFPLASPKAGTEEKILTDFVEKYGLVTTSKPISSSFGAFIAIPNTEAAKKFSVENMPANQVPSIEVANNFETMPEHEVLPGTWDTINLENIVTGYPSGTIFHFADGSTVSKIQSTFEAPDASFSPYGMAAWIQQKGGATVQKPGQSKPKLKKLETAPPPKPVEWQKKEADPEALAKQTWAKDRPPVTAEQKKYLAWLQSAIGIDEPMYARQTKGSKGILLGHPDISGAELKKMIMEKTGLSAQVADTPFGSWVVFMENTLQKTFPEAETIKGPDGGDYPHGTTFDVKETPISVETVVKQAPAFKKIVPYAGDEEGYDKTVKLHGNDAPAKEHAENMIKEAGLEGKTGPIVQGSVNTLFGVSSSDLIAPSGKVETKVTPSIPKQPKPFQEKGLGLLTGAADEGQPAPNNRDELANTTDIVPHRHGYSIRFGEGGILMDGQLRMHKVKYPDGKVRIRLVGELTKKTPVLSGGSKQFQFLSSAASTPDLQLGDKWKENDYDPTTGIHTLSNTKIWSENPSTSANIPGGEVYTFYDHWDGLSRTFVVEIDAGADAEQAMAAAMQKLGVDVGSAMATQDEQDERILIKTQLFKAAIGPEGFREVEKLALSKKSKDQREDALDQALKGKVTKKAIKDAQLVVGHDGFHHVEAGDLDKLLFTDKKIKCVTTGISAEGIARVLKQGGYGGQIQTLWTGNSRNIDPYAKGTTSGESDVKSGGAYGKFFRVITSTVKTAGGVAGEKPKLLLHPRVLRKTNWYAHNTDAFGSQGSHKPGSYAPLTRKQIGGVSGSTNEVCIENVSPVDVMGAVVKTEAQKKKIIKVLTELGITEMGGAPLDQAIIVTKNGYPGYQLYEEAKQVPGLKEMY